jgi:hypothetical protein
MTYSLSGSYLPRFGPVTGRNDAQHERIGRMRLPWSCPRADPRHVGTVFILSVGSTASRRKGPSYALTRSNPWREQGDSLDMVRLRKHVDGLYRLDPKTAANENIEIAAQRFGVARYVRRSLWSPADDLG